jgi:hypothetical protein
MLPEGRKQQDREYILVLVLVLVLVQVDCDIISELKAASDKRAQRKCFMSVGHSEMNYEWRLSCSSRGNMSLRIS